MLLLWCKLDEAKPRFSRNLCLAGPERCNQGLELPTLFYLVVEENIDLTEVLVAQDQRLRQYRAKCVEVAVLSENMDLEDVQSEVIACLRNALSEAHDFEVFVIQPVLMLRWDHLV